MAESEEKLAWDLAVLQEMAGQMAEYLPSETMFWPMKYSDMPQLTLGGYWLRQHRLAALKQLLTQEQQDQFGAAVDQFETAVSGWLVRTEQRAHAELETRIRQWSEYLRDIQGGKGTDIAAYPAQVETRAIMAALLNQLRQSPYRLDESLAHSIARQDKSLQARWQSGSFVWPEPWAPAYPKTDYWWLYGRPR